jgi:hypothetical protein
VLKSSLELFWVKFVPFTLGPSLMAIIPGLGSGPKVGIWLEFFDHSLKVTIVFLFFSNQEFLLVEKSGFL